MLAGANVIPLSGTQRVNGLPRLRALRERKRQILVVDDEPLLLSGIRRALKRMKYEAICMEDPLQALAYLDENGPVDVILTDQRMPYMSGAELLQRVQERWPEMVRVCMSGHADRPEILESINAGHVYRFLMKPWDLPDFQNVIEAAVQKADVNAESDVLGNVLEYQNRSLREDNEGLHVVVKKRTRELEEKSKQLDAALMETVRALAYSIEAKDAYTAGHSELVSLFSVALAQRIGLEGEDLECLRLGGVLHDVGKLGVPDRILLKPGRLDRDEYEVIKAHPEIGARILSHIHFPFDIIPIVRLHHERWDGGGYPEGRNADETPLLARVVHVVDVYEAITAKRVYRNPMPLEKVISIFENGSGTDFDPALVRPFLDLLDEGVFDEIRASQENDVEQVAHELSFDEEPTLELRED